MKCNETLGKWCKNKHEASKIMDTLETYQLPYAMSTSSVLFYHQLFKQLGSIYL
jgi:hypothetical protein